MTTQIEAYAVPLQEQLSSVPDNARLVIDDPDGMGTRFIPVGRMCNEAAAELRRQEARLTEAERVMKEGRLTLIMLEGDIEWRESSVTLRQLKRTLKAFDGWLKGEK